MSARLTIPLVLWVLAASSVAAATIQFAASVDRTRAGEGEPIRLTLRITSDEQLSQVTPAFDLKDFRVEGPATSTRMEMSNFTNVSFTRELTYVLYAKQAGTFTIGPARLEMGGEHYQTKPITVEIVRGTSRTQADQADDPPIFVLARANHQRAYVGQQVTVSYDLFYRIQPHNVSFNKLPTFVGFWTEDVFVAQQLEAHQEVRGGASFNVAPLRRVALFPTSAGTHAVGTLTVSCDIPQKRSRRGGLLDDFFAGDPFGRSRSVLLQSEALQIEVLPLPEQGRPAEFTGAVGRFQLRVEAQPTQVAAGDPVTLQVLVEGEGNMAAVQPLQVDAAAGVKLYDPKVEEEERITNGAYGGRRLFEYILIPEQGGTLNIPPLRFAYFDPHQGRYEVLESAPIAIHSEGRVEEEGVSYGLSRRDIEAVGEDIRYIKPDVEALVAGTMLHESRWFWTLQGALPIAFFALLLWQRHQRRLQGDVAYARQRRAKGEAGRRLARADALLTAGTEAEFYGEVRAAVLEFVADRLNLAAAGLTIEVCAAALAARRVDAETIAALRDLLTRCDFARFAPAGGPPTDRAAARRVAGDVIAGLEKMI